MAGLGGRSVHLVTYSILVGVNVHEGCNLRIQRQSSKPILHIGIQKPPETDYGWSLPEMVEDWDDMSMYE